MRKILLLLAFSFFIDYHSFAQEETCPLQISLLTCSPGGELYTTWGHTAIRVRDARSGLDLVYNYGTFVFDEHFYAKFIKGNLLYSLSVETFDSFMEEYAEDRRNVQEQIFQISCEEKERLQRALDSNAQEAHRYYRYNFLYDNCTTRARDIVAKNTSHPVVFHKIVSATPPSFRRLIHDYLDAGHEYWSELGIDLLMGTPVDKKVNTETVMFLPDYLLKGFDAATVDGNRLVSPARAILSPPAMPNQLEIFTPLVVFTILFLVVAVVSFLQNSFARRFFNVFDPLFFMVIGLAGWVMLAMWLGTEHDVCRNNFNLLFALPTHVAAAFFLGRKKWVSVYFRAVFVLSILLLLSWWLLPQQMNNALIPIVLIVIVRSLKLQKSKAYDKKRDAFPK